MHRRTLALALAAVFSAPCVGFAQSRDKMVRIGVLMGDLSTQKEEQALVDGLREQGLVEGRNLVIERRYGFSNLSLVPAYARELAAMNLDAVVSTCTPTTLIAQRFIGSTPQSTPIIMAAVADPVGQKIVTSLARPGANVTGLASQAEDIMPKILSQFAVVLQRPTKVAVLVDASSNVHPRMVLALQKSALQLNLALVQVNAGRRPGDASLSDAFDAAVRAGADGIVVLPDEPFFFASRTQIVDLAARHRLPAIYGLREYVDAGGLMSYGEDLNTAWRSIGSYVSRIVAGNSPATIPVMQPTRFELVLNLKTARELGITVPGELLLSANAVIR